ncbi:MAG: sigma-70 family RNA polymerase sigma factor [Nannocystaceae bacterium]
MADHALIKTLYYRHHNFVASLARHKYGVRMGGVDDVVQEVFLVVYRKLPGTQLQREVRPWLGRITFFVARNYLKSGVGGYRHFEKMNKYQRFLGDVGRAQPGADPETLVKRSMAERYISILTPEQREVFMWADYEGHTGEEIAAHLGIPRPTVAARLGAARKRLREMHARENAQSARVAPNTMAGVRRELAHTPVLANKEDTDRSWALFLPLLAASREAAELGTIGLGCAAITSSPRPVADIARTTAASTATAMPAFAATAAMDPTPLLAMAHAATRATRWKGAGRISASFLVGAGIAAGVPMLVAGTDLEASSTVARAEAIVVDAPLPATETAVHKPPPHDSKAASSLGTPVDPERGHRPPDLLRPQQATLDPRRSGDGGTATATAEVTTTTKPRGKTKNARRKRRRANAPRPLISSREISLLENAQIAFSRGDLQRTRALLSSAAKEFPDGQLAQDRRTLHRKLHRKLQSEREATRRHNRPNRRAGVRPAPTPAP